MWFKNMQVHPEVWSREANLLNDTRPRDSDDTV